MTYLAEVVMWLLAGAAAGLGLGEGISRLRRASSRNRRP
jgi:glucose-6-phosphate-specific signal transduction histidine kinase